MKTFSNITADIEKSKGLHDLQERKPLNIAQRRKLAIRMKRLSKSGAFKKKRELSLRRVATGDKLMKRAMKRAKMINYYLIGKSILF